MIQNGTNVDLNDKRGNSPITYAIKNNNVEVVNILIKNKANLDQMNQDKSTPLTIAINNNNINMVKLLIDSGADVNKLESIIFLACDKNKTEIFSYLIEHGANCNVKDNNGTPLLLLAIRNNINFDCIKKLVENNVNINERDNNGIDPLLEVIETNNTEIIKFLIDYSQKNNIKMNPINIELAISKLGYSILEYLLSSSSISIDSNQQREGKSLIIIIKSDKYSLEEKEKLIELLIEKGMNVDYINEEDGNTALYYATEKEYFSIIKLLVDKGANYLVKNKNGNSIKNLIEEMEDYEILSYFMDKGIISDTDSDSSDKEDSDSNDKKGSVKNKNNIINEAYVLSSNSDSESDLSSDIENKSLQSNYGRNKDFDSDSDSDSDLDSDSDSDINNETFIVNKSKRIREKKSRKEEETDFSSDDSDTDDDSNNEGMIISKSQRIKENKSKKEEESDFTTSESDSDSDINNEAYV
eukprot:jgi/Orpsp1_1/1188692/evm.model.d7180000066551.1